MHVEGVVAGSVQLCPLGGDIVKLCEGYVR
jgi:hypothetical protein